MNLVEVTFLAIALGIDCLVVSFSQGLLVRQQRKKISLILATIMGLFQGGMPIISYILTQLIYDYVSPFAKSLVFGIFLFLGGKFIIEALSGQENLPQRLGYRMMIILGIATSIDALGAGISLKLTNTPLVISACIITLASFIMSLLGFWGASLLEKVNTKYLEISAGLILIFLAVKALL